MSKETNKKKAEEIGCIVNSLGFNPKGVCEELTREHRTLQADFYHLAIEWIKTVGAENYLYDGRNELEHKHAQKLLKALKEIER